MWASRLDRSQGSSPGGALADVGAAPKGAGVPCVQGSIAVATPNRLYCRRTTPSEEKQVGYSEGIMRPLMRPSEQRSSLALPP